MHFIVFVPYCIPFMTGACQSLISGCEKKLIFVYFRRKQQFETCINNNLMKFLITCLPLSYIVRISFNKFLKYTWLYYFTKITDTSRLFYLHALDD